MQHRLFAFLLTLFAVAFSALPASAASGYDVSDLWWNPAEAGWGITFVQQRDTVFATLYVYDPSQRASWYSATLAFEGLTPQAREVNYGGDLYETTGPWFETLPFAPTAVVRRKVGTMQFRSPDLTRGTLTYTVDGISVIKSVERQTFRIDEYAGDYAASFSVSTTRCNAPRDDGTLVSNVTMQVIQSAGAMNFTVSGDGKTCSYAGPYTQNGRLGSVFTNYSCSSGEVGALVFEEMNVQRFGMMGRLFGTDNRGCHIEGRFAAVRP